MGDRTFGFRVRSERSGQVLHRRLKVDFGDGYSQSAADGINTKTQIWNIEVRGHWNNQGAACSRTQSIKEVSEFLDSTGGWESFFWTPPKQTVPLKFECDSYSLQEVGNGIFTLSAVFKQVYR